MAGVTDKPSGVRLIHVNYGGPTRLMKMPNGRYVTFEDHPRFGPSRTYPNGEPSKTQFSEHSEFWPLYEAWCAAGKPVDEANRCITDAEAIAAWSRRKP